MRSNLQAILASASNSVQFYHKVHDKNPATQMGCTILFQTTKAPYSAAIMGIALRSSARDVQLYIYYKIYNIATRVCVQTCRERILK